MNKPLSEKKRFMTWRLSHKRAFSYYKEEDIKKSIKECEKLIEDELQINTIRKEKLEFIDIIKKVFPLAFGKELLEK